MSPISKKQQKVTLFGVKASQIFYDIIAESTRLDELETHLPSILCKSSKEIKMFAIELATLFFEKIPSDAREQIISKLKEVNYFYFLKDFNILDY